MAVRLSHWPVRVVALRGRAILVILMDMTTSGS